MRRKNTNVLLVFGVVIAIILLMIWLFLGTTLEQEANPETDPMTVELHQDLRFGSVVIRDRTLCRYPVREVLQPVLERRQ